jgi:hypothetical protein
MKTKKCQYPMCKRRVRQQEWKTDYEKTLCLKHFVIIKITKEFDKAIEIYEN